MPTVPFDDLMANRGRADSDLDHFEAVARRHFEEAAEATFGIGDAIARRRSELGLSQKHVARLTAISQADISRIERSRGNPKLSTLLRLASALGLRLELVPLVYQGVGQAQRLAESIDDPIVVVTDPPVVIEVKDPSGHHLTPH